MTRWIRVGIGAVTNHMKLQHVKYNNQQGIHRHQTLPWYRNTAIAMWPITAKRDVIHRTRTTRGDQKVLQFDTLSKKLIFFDC